MKGLRNHSGVIHFKSTSENHVFLRKTEPLIARHMVSEVTYKTHLKPLFAGSSSCSVLLTVFSKMRLHVDTSAACGFISERA